MASRLNKVIRSFSAANQRVSPFPRRDVGHVQGPVIEIIPTHETDTKTLPVLHGRCELNVGSSRHLVQKLLAGAVRVLRTV